MIGHPMVDMNGVESMEPNGNLMDWAGSVAQTNHFHHVRNQPSKLRILAPRARVSDVNKRVWLTPDLTLKLGRNVVRC